VIWRRHALIWSPLAIGGIVFGIGAAAAASDAAIERGRALFIRDAKPPCAVCHSLRDAEAAGEIGPSLDELKPDEDRVRGALQTGVGLMPAFDSLSEEEKDALARYVAKAAGR
jgi:sulfite dehydrogenase